VMGVRLVLRMSLQNILMPRLGHQLQTGAPCKWYCSL